MQSGRVESHRGEICSQKQKLIRVSGSVRVSQLGSLTRKFSAWIVFNFLLQPNLELKVKSGGTKTKIETKRRLSFQRKQTPINRQPFLNMTVLVFGAL